MKRTSIEKLEKIDKSEEDMKRTSKRPFLSSVEVVCGRVCGQGENSNQNVSSVSTVSSSSLLLEVSELESVRGYVPKSHSVTSVRHIGQLLMPLRRMFSQQSMQSQCVHRVGTELFKGPSQTMTGESVDRKQTGHSSGCCQILTHSSGLAFFQASSISGRVSMDYVNG